MKNNIWTPSMREYYKRLNEISSFYGKNEFKRNSNNLLVCVKQAENENRLDQFSIDDHMHNNKMSSESSAATKRLKYIPKTVKEKQAINFRRGMGTPNVDLAYNVKTKDIDVGNFIIQVSRTDELFGNNKGPCFVFYHGGDFVGNGLDVSRNFCRKLAEIISGTVVNVDYRLSPEANSDYLLSDCWNAILYVRDNAEKMNVDLNRLFVTGDSAGGNLSIEMAYLDQAKQANLVKGIVPIYPMVQNDIIPDYENLQDLSQKDKKLINAMDSGNINSLKFLDEIYGAPHSMSNILISPFNFNDNVMKKLPRTMIIAAQYDCLKKQGYQFANRLSQFNNDVEYLCYNGMMHGFIDKFGIVPQSEDVCRQIAAWALQ